MKIVVIDGQGGNIGKRVVEEIKANGIQSEVMAIGTNSTATAQMMKGGADIGATGENPVVLAKNGGGCGSQQGKKDSYPY